MDAARRPLMDRFILDGMARAHGTTTPIITLNYNPSGNPEGTALYTFRYGALTPRDTSRATTEAPMTSAGRRGDTLLYVRRGPVSTTSGSAIPAGGAGLAAYGPGLRAKEVPALAGGDNRRGLLRTLATP